MRVLFLLALLVVGVAADVPLMDADLASQIKEGQITDVAKKASLLQTNARTVVFDKAEARDDGVTQDPDGTQSVPLSPITKAKTNECAACNAIDDRPEDNPAAQAMAVEISAMDAKIMAVQAQIEETQACADELEERRRKVEELTGRWAMLSDAEKRQILRNKLIIEESSIAHVHQMTEILARKVAELTDAKKSIEEKAALTGVALEDLKAMKAGSGQFIQNATDEIQTVQLGNELKALHEAMKKSLVQSNDHITSLTAKVDGLHDVSFWSNVTGVGGTASKDLIKAINSPERLEKFKAFVEAQQKRATDNAAIDADIADRKANGVSLDGKAATVGGVSQGLLELKAEKQKLEAKEKKQELKDTIRKLKKKLQKKRKHKKKVDEDY